MIPLFLLSSFSFTAKRSELVGFVALRDSAAPLSFSFVLQPRCIHTERWQRKERRRGIIGRQLYSGGEPTEPTEPLTPAWTTCADAERKHAIRLRACSGRRQRHSLMRARRLRVTQRALFGRNCQRTARPGGCRATSALPRHLLGFLLLALCSRTLLPSTCSFYPCSPSFKSHGWTSSLSDDMCILFVACAACASVLTA